MTHSTEFWEPPPKVSTDAAFSGANRRVAFLSAVRWPSLTPLRAITAHNLPLTQPQPLFSLTKHHIISN